MNRRPHYLDANKTKFRPQYHIFVDVESRLDAMEGGWRSHHFRLGQALYWRRRLDDRADAFEWFSIDSLPVFWAWVEDHVPDKTRLLLVSHNLNYDLIMLRIFQELPYLDWELVKFYSEQGCKIFTFKKGRKTIQCVDNANWFKGSLASWGEVVGYPKLQVDFDDVTDEDLEVYCKRDVEILYQLWLWWYQFLDDHDAGAWGVTVPSQAFNAFRHRFLNHKIWIHNNEEVLDLERESYHGGRSECFRQGSFDSDTYYKLDVNSMYPFVMSAYPYPTSLRGSSEMMTVQGLEYLLHRYCVVAKVLLNCDLPYFPAKVKDRIAYPVGRFAATLTSPEIELALSRGWIEEVYDTAWYKRDFVFKEYVNYWYNLKAECDWHGDLLRRRLTKLFLNSLYGKFGQMSSSMEEIGECDPDRFDIVRFYDTIRRQWRTEYYVGGKVFVSLREGNSYHAFPAIAAHVTAYARLYLYDAILKVGRKHCYYCDTDSLIIDQRGFDRISDQTDPYLLGALKVESIADRLTIFARKDYIMGDVVKVKGVRKDAVWLGPNVVKQEIFPSIVGLMGQGVKETYRTKQQTKVLQRTIKTGFVDSDGVVHPLALDSLL